MLKIRLNPTLQESLLYYIIVQRKQIYKPTTPAWVTPQFSMGAAGAAVKVLNTI